MDIIVEQKTQVTTITLNRPAAMNAITPEMHEGLHAAFDAFAAQDSQRICVVKGAGEQDGAVKGAGENDGAVEGGQIAHQRCAPI